MSKEKPYYTSCDPDQAPEWGIVHVTGKTDKTQRGTLAKVEGKWILHGLVPGENSYVVRGYDPGEPRYSDFDAAARIAYMRGWVYYWTEGSREIRVLPDAERGEWISILYEKGILQTMPKGRESLEDAKHMLLHLLYPHHHSDRLREISQQEWMEKKMA
jgi:hypothetical protein